MKMKFKLGDRVKTTLGAYHPLSMVSGTVTWLPSANEPIKFYGVEGDNGVYQPLIHIFLELDNPQIKVKKIV